MTPQDIATLEERLAALGREVAQLERETADPYAGRANPALSGMLADATARRDRAAGQLAAAIAKRKADLAAIHAQAKRAGIDEPTRRALIARVSGGRSESSGELTAPERAAVLRALGGSSRARPAGRGPSLEALDREQMLHKVQALLADQGLPWAYAEAILRRQRGILDKRVGCPIAQTSPQELKGVIAALWRRAKRQQTPPAPVAG